MRKLLLMLLIGATALSCSENTLKYVDPTIGGVGLILQPTRPTVHLPNSMLRTYPVKTDQLDDRIHYFTMNMPSHRVSYTFRFLPVRGSSGLWQQTYKIETEESTPYLYSAKAEVTGDNIAVSVAEHSAIYKIAFCGNDDRYLRISTESPLGNISVEGNVIKGEDLFNGVKAYLYAEIDVPVDEIIYNEQKNAALIAVNSDDVYMKYGTSYISADQAKSNLYKEIPDWNFEQVVETAEATWTSTIDRIKVKGGTEAQKRVFYTALYRCYERMVDINEYGRYYSAFDHQIHESDRPFYVDNWLWDLYIAHQPLYMILNPDMVADEINSYIAMYEQGGWMPSFAVAFGDWPAMTGNNAAIWMTDAWAKGIRAFDFDKAYEGMKKGSLEATLLPWNNGPATELDKFYNEYGYMPGLRAGEKETVPQVDEDWEKRQCVSVTVDNSYSDWCIAQMADFDNNTVDYDLFHKRALNYRNVFREDKGFVWPKDKDGNWIEPFDPRFAGREYFTENNAYIFNWCAKHDFTGLFSLMGGKDKAEEKLDQLFREDLGLPKFKFWYTQPDASGLVGQYVMGNEPAFHIPYLYNYLGAPWKTQKRIRMLLDTWFKDDVFGIPGDEDGGGMSSFVVFSMMGFFQVVQGIPVYSIGSPVFDEVSLTLTDGKVFKVKAYNNSEKNKYITKAFLNGEKLDRSWFTHEDIINGGLLELYMDDTPNYEWGASDDLLPKSNVNLRIAQK